MTTRNSSAVLLAALLVLGACGRDTEMDAGASVEPGPTGTIESTVADVPDRGAADAPNAPPAMTSPATEGDTTVRQVP